MNYVLNIITSYSIVLPAVVAIVRFSKIGSIFIPFVICIWVGLANELLSTGMIRWIGSNAINSNSYVLIEALLLLWLFFRWRTIAKSTGLFPVLLIVMIVVWTMDNVVLSEITRFNSWCRIFYATCILFLAIVELNKILFLPNVKVSQDAAFIICCGFVLYYTYKVVVEAFWIYGLNDTPAFRKDVYVMMDIINLIVNVLYTYAIIWIRKNKIYTLPF